MLKCGRRVTGIHDSHGKPVKIPNRRFQVAVPQPGPNRPQIKARPQDASRERQTKFVQPEVFFVELGM
jgi:hypothetical protein